MSGWSKLIEIIILLGWQIALLFILRYLSLKLSRSRKKKGEYNTLGSNEDPTGIGPYMRAEMGDFWSTSSLGGGKGRYRTNRGDVRRNRIAALLFLCSYIGVPITILFAYDLTASFLATIFIMPLVWIFWDIRLMQA